MYPDHSSATGRHLTETLQIVDVPIIKYYDSLSVHKQLLSHVQPLPVSLITTPTALQPYHMIHFFQQL